MKFISGFLSIVLAALTFGAHASPVATTAGSNLTAYNPNGGVAGNNAWNNMTNPRSGAESAPAADFGNCNALILRCAQPKCSSGGCTDMNVTSAIVSGCVNSNDTCSQYGADLVSYISAQLVAQSTARANQAAAAAQNAAAQQSSQQLAAMQQQMQEQMASLQQQISDSNANMQAAIAAQQQAAVQAAASASSANSYAPVASDDTTELNVAQRVAVESGVSEDLVMRETISGQILTQIENAEKSLKTLEQTMQTAFKYAGCDSRGDNCTGPKRVKKFKDLAGQFFDPYEDVLNDLFDAILTAQSVGVDVSNIYMLLNNSCDRWGKYACSKPMTVDKDNVTGKNVYTWPRYDNTTCPNGKSVRGAPIVSCKDGKYTYENGILTCAESAEYGYGSVRGGMECYPGQTIPPEDDTSCTFIGNLTTNDNEGGGVSRAFLYPEEGDMGDMVRVGCASNALKGSWLFRGKKQQATIDIETLRRIIEQDSSQISFARQSKNALGQQEQLKYCALTESGYMNLQKYVGLRGLPTRDICISERKLNQNLDRIYVGESDSIMAMAEAECTKKSGNPAFSRVTKNCYCYAAGTDMKPAAGTQGDSCDDGNSKKKLVEAEERFCRDSGGAYHNGVCDCNTGYNVEDDAMRELCETRFERPDTTTTARSNNSGTNSGGGNILPAIQNAFNVPTLTLTSSANTMAKCGVLSYNTTCCACVNDRIVDRLDKAHINTCANVRCI